jgi:hypothetical protein
MSADIIYGIDFKGHSIAGATADAPTPEERLMADIMAQEDEPMAFNHRLMDYQAPDKDPE